MNWKDFNNADLPHWQRYYREEIQRRVEHVQQMQRDGESPEVVVAMVRFWRKWDKVRGFLK